MVGLYLISTAHKIWGKVMYLHPSVHGGGGTLHRVEGLPPGGSAS